MNIYNALVDNEWLYPVGWGNYSILDLFLIKTKEGSSEKSSGWFTMAGVSTSEIEKRNPDFFYKTENKDDFIFNMIKNISISNNIEPQLKKKFKRKAISQIFSY